MRISAKRRNNFSNFLFVAPHLLLFIVFLLIPILFGVYISFTRWDLAGTPQWVGLDNYMEILFNKDSTFHFQFFNGLKNTLIYVVTSLPLLVGLPLLLALAMSAKIKGTGFFQAVFYVPGLFSISAIAIIWLLVFNKRVGPINNLFNSDVVWTTTQPYAWIVILVVSGWAFLGGNMIIYRAALSGISADLYEAAAIDGAGAFSKFLKITLPSIKFQLLYTTVTTTIASFGIYGQARIMTEGKPNQTTFTLIMYIRELAFSKGKSIAGIASSMAILMGFIMLVITAVQFWLMKRKD